MNGNPLYEQLTGTFSPQGISHDTLVSTMAWHFVRRGLYVEADHIAGPFVQPRQISGYIPDIWVVDNTIPSSWTTLEKVIVVEAETFDSLNDGHTRLQWDAFSLATCPPNSEFHVIVPESCLNAAQRNAEYWGVGVW